MDESILLPYCVRGGRTLGSPRDVLGIHDPLLGDGGVTYGVSLCFEKSQCPRICLEQNPGNFCSRGSFPIGEILLG